MGANSNDLQTFADSMSPPNDAKCDICGANLIFLMQLATPYKETIQRALFLYFCRDHVEENGGWKVYRYTSTVEVVAVPKLSAFDEMNSLSSWVTDIDIFSTKTKGNGRDGVEL